MRWPLLADARLSILAMGSWPPLFRQQEQCDARSRFSGNWKNTQENPKHPLEVRVGAAAGEPVEQNNDLFGSTVQLAARLCAHARPQQILVSNAIAELCIGKGLSFEDVGEVTLKGFDSPVRAHAAAWRQ